MAITVDGITYLSLPEVLAQIGVTRQTLWRWRSEGRIPAGQRYRGQFVLFTLDETAQIRNFAHRVEPTAATRQRLAAISGRARTRGVVQ